MLKSSPQASKIILAKSSGGRGLQKIMATPLYTSIISFSYHHFKNIQSTGKYSMQIHQKHRYYDTGDTFLPFLYFVSKKLRKASAFYRSYLMMTLSLSGGSPTDNCFCRTNRSVAAYTNKDTRYF